MSASPNETFYPYYLVRRVHHLYHMNSKLELVDNHFNITSTNFDPNGEYEEGLVTLPYYIASFSTLLIIVFIIALWARVCFDRCRCRPDYNTESIFNAPFLRKYFGSTKYLRRAFIFCALCVVIFDNFMIYGDVLIIAGFDLGNDNFNYFKYLFSSLDSDGEALQAAGYSISNLVNQSLSDCASAVVLNDPIWEFNNDVASYLHIVSPIYGHMEDYQSYYRYWVFIIGNNAFWGIYALLMVCVTAFAIGYWKQSRTTLQATLGVTIFVVFTMVWFVCFMLIFLMALADFCYEPTDNLVNLVPTGDDRALMSYYATCEGTNPLDSYISNAYSALDAINAELMSLTNPTTGACPDNPELVQAQDDVVAAYRSMDAIYVTEECPPVKSHIDSILHNAVCFNLFGGFYTIWVSQFTSSAALFFLCVVASVIYQYFGRYWGMQFEDMQSIMENIEEDSKVPLLQEHEDVPFVRLPQYSIEYERASGEDVYEGVEGVEHSVGTGTVTGSTEVRSNLPGTADRAYDYRPPMASDPGGPGNIPDNAPGSLRIPPS